MLTPNTVSTGSHWISCVKWAAISQSDSWHSVSLHNDKHINQTETNDTQVHVAFISVLHTLMDEQGRKTMIKIKNHHQFICSSVLVWKKYSPDTYIQIIMTLLCFRASFEHLIGHKNTSGAISDSLLIKWLRCHHLCSEGCVCLTAPPQK